jgi:hypothetical protein
MIIKKILKLLGEQELKPAVELMNFQNKRL